MYRHETRKLYLSGAHSFPSTSLGVPRIKKDGRNLFAKLKWSFIFIFVGKK